MYARHWIISIFTFLIFAVSNQAFAVCAAQDMDGTWKNIDQNTRGITKVKISFACNDIVINGQLSREPDTIQVWGSCHPSDCDWETTTLRNKFWDGRERQTAYSEAVYNKSFATTRLKFDRVNKNRLMVISLTDFKANNRPDYSSIAYFKK